SASVVVPRHQARAQGVPSMITKRIWKSGPRRIKRVAWGFTAQRNGKQVWRGREERAKEDAERAVSGWTVEGGTAGTAAGPGPAAGAGHGQPRGRAPALDSADGARLGRAGAGAGVRDDEGAGQAAVSSARRDHPAAGRVRGVAQPPAAGDRHRRPAYRPAQGRAPTPDLGARGLRP